MNIASIKKVSSWCIPVVALCAGVILGQRVSDVPVLSPAHAASAKGGLTAMEKLLIKDEINDKITLYALYADGDGPGGNPRNLKKMAETIMTPDIVSEIYLSKGGEPKIMKGRDHITNTAPEVQSEFAKVVVGRHYLVSTVFDEITPTTVKTRTPAVYFDSSSNQVGPPCTKPEETVCGGKPIKTIMWVYHMTWTKTPDGWQISRNILRDDN